jgi:carboxypeptidase family protein
MRWRAARVNAVAPLAVLFAVLFAPRSGVAQQPSRNVAVRIEVVDTAGHPIQGAEVALIRGLKLVVARGESDARGERTLTAPRVGAPIQVSARRLGFAPASAFVSASDQATVDVHLVLHAAAQTLAPVAVTAREDILRKRNHLGADDIANSARPILDGLDAITKLRPDMIDPPENSPADPCGLFYLWVNGRRVPLPSDSMPLEDGMVSSRLKTLTPAPLKWVALALAQIKPEHIEEVTYKGCNDKSMEGVATRNAAFVVLKPGIGYDWVNGSFVIGENDHTAAGQIARRERDRADHPPAAALPSYRHRLLGLYDQRTGDPIAGAAVVDSASGTTALTTATGTVSLVFLPDGMSAIRIQKPGYEPLRLDVRISPSDTTPLTLTLGAAKPR